MRRVPLLILAALLASGCRTPAEDPFARDPLPEDDDDDVVEPTNLGGAWIEFQRTTVFPDPSATAAAFATYFAPSDYQAAPPLPKELDACRSGTDEAADITLPGSTLDAGVTSLVLLDGTEAALEDWDPDAGRWRADISNEDWVPAQEYDVTIAGGEDIEARSLPGQLGTPEVMALLDTPTWTDDGLALRWFGANNNSHIEGRWISDPVEGGEDEGLVRWVTCRLHDDGEEVIDLDEFVSLDGLDGTFVLYRSRTTSFQFDEETFGTVVGSSVVTAAWEAPPLGDDDDSSADDDDSGR